MEDRDVEFESEDVAEAEDSSDTAVPAYSCRALRNEAERNRRNKLNCLIGELFQLLPLKNTSGKKLDKTSILRLSAAYLRNQFLSSIVVSGKVTKSRKQEESDPRKRKPRLWKQKGFCAVNSMLQVFDAIMLVVSSSGKIMFVSDTVQSILGHAPLSLVGKPLADLTSLEDQEQLRNLLVPDEVPDDEHTIGENGGSALVLRAPVTDFIAQKRSFYFKLKRRTANKGDTEQYELVHFNGCLYVPTRARQNRSSHGEANNSSLVGSSADFASDEIFLSGVVRLFRDHSLEQPSLLENSKEEYITRHTMDGRIIFCDQRISLVSGYLPSEVVGLSAFSYMHSSDVQWTIVALKQMFMEGEDYGSSCYRLRTKSNSFIYLKTFGYLEKDRETNTVDSFICINILVSEEEGLKAMRKMKTRFWPQYQLMAGPSRKANSSVIIKEVEDVAESAETVSDSEIQEHVDRMLQSVSEHNGSMSPASSCRTLLPQEPPTPECVLVTSVSKSLPPASTHAAQLGITDVPKLGASSGIGGQSPRMLHSTQGLSQPPPSPQEEDPGLVRPTVRPTVVCGPQSSVLSTSVSSPSSCHSPTTNEPVRKTVISGRKRNRSPSESPNSSPSSSPNPSSPRETSRGESSPKKKSVRTRTCFESDSIEPASGLGFTQTQVVRVTDVNNVSSPLPDLETLPDVHDVNAAGVWLMQHHETFSSDVGFQGKSFMATIKDPAFLGTPGLVTISESDGSFQSDNGAVIQQTREFFKELVLHQQYHLDTSLQAQRRSFSDISETLNQVPANAPSRQLIEREIVHLTVEHSRQEREYQELQRDTHNMSNYPMNACAQ